MKKLLAPVLGLIMMLGSFSVVSAQGNIVSTMINAEDNMENVSATTSFGGSAREAIRTIINYVLFFLGLIATVMVIYGGFLYMTSGGEDTEKAKKVLMYAAIGIVIVLISFALVNTILGSGMYQGGGEQ